MGAGEFGESQVENLGCRLRRKNHTEAHEEWGTDSCLAGEERTGTAGSGVSENGWQGSEKGKIRNNC